MRSDLSTGEALDRLLAFDGELRLEAYYGERSVFYNPGGTAPLGVIFASVKDHDGPKDAAARLSRPGVWRLAFGMSAEAFAARFGGTPARPPKGRPVALGAWDVTRLDELTPHPVYAWMGWAQILSALAYVVRAARATARAVTRPRSREMGASCSSCEPLNSTASWPVRSAATRRRWRTSARGRGRCSNATRGGCSKAGRRMSRTPSRMR